MKEKFDILRLETIRFYAKMKDFPVMEDAKKDIIDRVDKLPNMILRWVAVCDDESPPDYWVFDVLVKRPMEIYPDTIR